MRMRVYMNPSILTNYTCAVQILEAIQSLLSMYSRGRLLSVIIVIHDKLYIFFNLKMFSLTRITDNKPLREHPFYIVGTLPCAPFVHLTF